MSKEPAFLFYPNDWLGGTMYFTFEQKGCYLDLLLLQVSTGKFTESQAKQVLNTSYSSVWDIIKSKFLTDGTYFWNEKMAKVLEARKSFTESRRNNRLGKTKTKKLKKNTRKTLVKLVGIGDGNTEMDLVFRKWYVFRAKIKKPIHEASIEAAKKKLSELSGGNPALAEKIINQSIANGWQGLFKLKNNKNGK